MRLFASLLLLAFAYPLTADTSLNFDGFPDSTIVLQLPGLIFSNAIILSGGISLNEFELPPRSGTNVAADDNGPMSITFTSPVVTFSGYFTYRTTLSIKAFDAQNNQVASATSKFSSNLALSGTQGSSPNEFMQVTFGSGISRVTITGDPLGSSFSLDDALVVAGNPTTLGPLSVAPGSGTGSTQPFVFMFSDPKGFQDLGILNILINDFLDGRHGCYLAYVRQANLLLLVDDLGNAGGPFIGQMIVDGSSATIENSQCRINGAGSSVSGNGATLTLTLNMTFKPGFAGNRIMYVAARDIAENNSNWQALGVWQATGSPTTTITAVNASPGRSSGKAQSFVFTFTDSKGASDIEIANLLLNDFVDGRHGCYVAYVRSANLLVLVDDLGNAGGPFAGQMTLNGAANTIQNSQCQVNGAGSSATQNGNTLTLTLNMTFLSGFAGNRILYVAARDPLGGNNTGWQALGTYTIQP